jgi:hypothetical protein
MIGSILHQAKEIFPEAHPELLHPVAHVKEASDFEELLKTGSFFPHFPYHSKLRQSLINNPKSEVQSCTKNYKSAGKLGAGVLLFWCLRHRECLGFVILEKGESCQAVYNVLSTRFSVMPQYVIYDNACNLYEVIII